MEQVEVNEIEAWLSQSDPNYQVGVELFLKHSTHQGLKRSLSLFSGKTNHAILRHELNKMVRQQPQAKQKKEEDNTGKEEKGIIATKEGVAKIQNEKNKAFKVAANAHASLRDEVPQEKRAVAVQEIYKQFDETVEPAWETLDHIRDTGHLPKKMEPPAGEKVEKLSSSEIRKRINRHRKYISSNRDTKDPERLKEMERRRDELDQLLKEEENRDAN